MIGVKALLLCFESSQVNRSFLVSRTLGSTRLEKLKERSDPDCFGSPDCVGDGRFTDFQGRFHWTEKISDKTH